MTSAAEKPNHSDVPKPGSAGSTAALASDGAVSAPPRNGSANGNGTSAESSENGFWSAAKPSENFDDYAAEEHASKVFALWEIAPSLTQPATGASQGPTTSQGPAGAEPSAPVAATLPAENDVWAAAGATERMESPPIAAHQEALAQATPTRVAQPRPFAQTRVSPIEPSTTSSVDVTGALPALPESRSTRNVLLGAVALVGLLVVGSGIAMFSGAAPAAPLAAPPTVAAPPTPPAAAPPTTTTTTAPRIAEAPVPAVQPAVAPPDAVAAAVEPTAVAPAPVVVAPPVAPEPPPTMHRLRIRTIPASATLLVDGQTVANPYDGRLIDGSSHALVARAEGYVESTQTIELESNRELTLRLDRIPTPRPEPVARTPRATPEPAAARTPRATPTAARAERRAARRPASTIRPRETGAAGAGFVTESPY